jgi:hypothetical protein
VTGAVKKKKREKKGGKEERESDHYDIAKSDEY